MFRDIPICEQRFLSYLLNEMKSILLLSLVCIFAPPVTGSATALLVQSRSPNCEGDFELTDYAFSCVGDECLFGSEVQVSGTCKFAYVSKVDLRLPLSLVMVCKVYSETGFADSQNIDIKVCPFDYEWSCYTIDSFLATNVCNSLVVLDGQECPFQGNYTFELQYTLPGDEGQNLYWGWSFRFEVLFYSSNEDERSTTVCSVSVQTTKSKYQMVWSVVGFSILGSAIASIGISRRNKGRRISSEIPIEGIEFRRMSDIGGHRALV